jgi:hypothetical protein
LQQFFSVEFLLLTHIKFAFATTREDAFTFLKICAPGGQIQKIFWSIQFQQSRDPVRCHVINSMPFYEIEFSTRNAEEYTKCEYELACEYGHVHKRHGGANFYSWDWGHHQFREFILEATCDLCAQKFENLSHKYVVNLSKRTISTKFSHTRGLDFLVIFAKCFQLHLIK